MKKQIFILMVVLICALAAAGIVSAQSAMTPAKNSQVRKAIIAAVKQKFGRTQKNIDNPSVLKVQGSWARIVYDLRREGSAGSTGVNLILAKNGAAWKIVWNYNEEGEEDPSDHIKGIPAGILMPWDN